MIYSEAKKKLESIKQAHLLDQWADLSQTQQQHLLTGIAALDAAVFVQQQAILKTPPPTQKLEFTPFENYSSSGNQGDVNLGKQLIHEGKAGCLLIAGGQGTRLRFEGPKGLYPITPVKKKSLFQLFAEKIIAAGKQAQRPLKLAIMTSPLNHDETLRFFQEHSFFGLNSGQIDFFQQEMLPLLDLKGNLYLDPNGAIAKGPNGNGSSLSAFWKSGIGPKWQSEGITSINYVLVDNPIADPFDAELLGFHHRHGDQATVKCSERKSSFEKVGVLVNTPSGVRVIEYSELSDLEKEARLPDGTLKHKCANLSLFCFQLSFIRALAESATSLPWHLAKKAAKFFPPSQETNSWKFEQFIFDVLPFAKPLHVLLYPRDQSFAPLKSCDHEGTPAEVQAALTHVDRRALTAVTDTPCPTEVLEIDQDFYYPTPELIEHWNGASIPRKSYIESSY